MTIELTWKPALLCPLLLVGAAASASAQELECEADADCGHGFVCETSQAECPAIEIDCPEEDPDCERRRACEPTVYANCVLAPCQEDADCPQGLSCHTESYERCEGGQAVACSDGPDGPDCTQPEEPEPSSCETVEVRSCKAPWELPCAEDADCGEGFACVELEACGCSGSAGSADAPGEASSSGTAGASGGAGGAGGSSGGEGDSAGSEEPQAQEPESESSCSCEPTGEFWCDPQEIVCQEDAECPQGWSCASNPLRAVCTRTDPPEGGSPESSSCPDQESPEKVCTPPYYAQRGDGAVRLDAASESAPGQGVPTGGTQDGFNNQGSGEASEQTEAEEGGNGAQATGDTTEDDDGCSLAGDRVAGGRLLWLALPLFVLGRARRRTGRRN